MTDTCSGLHDPYEDQLAAARYRAERDMLAQAMERVADDIEWTFLGFEGEDDAPAMRWAREFRAALGSLHAPGFQKSRKAATSLTSHSDASDVTMSAHDLLPEEEREAIAWVREHGGIEELRRMFRDADSRRVELCGALGIDIDKGWSEAMAAMRLRLVPRGMEWLVEAWPRFEDGEPVRFLDDFERYGDENGVSVVTVYADGSFALNFRAYSKGERVNRPAPKVLDADGVKICEKCDVWWICEGDERGVHAERLRIETICPNGLIECSPYNGGTWVYLEPSELYVNKPVPASDGRPLREGETVYLTDSPTAFVVDDIMTREDGATVVHLNGGAWHLPQDLTHELPDSWERLEEDADRTANLFDAFDSDASADIRDLVRRARALAERGE